MPNNDLNSDAKYVLLACVQQDGAGATKALTSLGTKLISFPADGTANLRAEKYGDDDRKRFIAIYDPNNSEGGNGGFAVFCRHRLASFFAASAACAPVTRGPSWDSFVAPVIRNSIQFSMRSFANANTT